MSMPASRFQKTMDDQISVVVLVNALKTLADDFHELSLPIKIVTGHFKTDQSARRFRLFVT